MKVFTVEYHYVTDRNEEMAEVRPTHWKPTRLIRQVSLLNVSPASGTR